MPRQVAQNRIAAERFYEVKRIGAAIPEDEFGIKDDLFPGWVTVEKRAKIGGREMREVYQEKLEGCHSV